MATLKAKSDEILRLSQRLGRKLLIRGDRVVTAESCTGGWIAKALTDVPGSSQWFSEGYVTYSNAAKQRDLNVAAVILQRHGAVSRQTVEQMARGALRRTGATLAVAVSGVAGPDGGTREKPVGMVWFAWARVPRRKAGASAKAGVAGMPDVSGMAAVLGKVDDKAKVRTALRRFRGNREAVRRKSVAFALKGLLASR